MTDKLKPLTPEEQTAFDHRRQSDAVVQVKCASCGSWYETPRGSVDRKEAFKCDAPWSEGICGAAISYDVPAIANAPVSLIKPGNEDLIALTATDGRLDSGMKVDEAIARAQAWWAKTGRKQMKRELKRQNQTVGGSNNGIGSQFATMDEADGNFLPSNVIHGKRWDRLNKREKVSIVKIWHHFHIRNPDLLGEAQATHKIQDRGLIQ